MRASWPARLWLLPLWLAAGCLTLPAQIRTVDPQKTITFTVPGATAAYSLDASFAEAAAENGLVSLTGKQPGATHIVVVTSSGAQTFEVLVTTPPPRYPPGFVMPVNTAEAAQSGYVEGRYYSSPSQVQTQFDFLKIHGDDRTHVHIVETNLVGPLDQGLPRVALSAASYEIVTPRRDITLFDKFVDESQLTINGSMIRGFHMAQDNWFVHAGYTSVATFAGLFLPVQPEVVAGGGYRYPLTANSSLTGSFYQVRAHASDLLAHPGSIGDIRYKYSPRENMWFTADLGISRGIGGAEQLYYKTDRDSLTALIRYMPLRFASLGANNFRGVHTDLSWTRHVTARFESTLTFYNNNVVLPNLKETTVSGAANLRYQLTSHWAVTGGALASKFQTQVPPSAAIRSFTLPAGLAFQSRHFGANGQYQFAVTPGRETGSQQSRASVHSNWGAFTFTGYAERDTNAPTLSFIYGQVAGLQQLLDQQGIRATTVQQVDELLARNSDLIAAGYIKGATINLVPVRTQLGDTVDWSSRGLHRKQVNYSFLYNHNQTLQGSTEDVIHTLSYSQSITSSDDLSAACSIQVSNNPGGAAVYAPVCFIAWRHQFQHVPYFIIPERRGTIAGKIFRDDQSKGALEPDMPPVPEVEVVLDDRRRILTRADGSYRFSSVPRGAHKLAVKYHSQDPFFFTTPSEMQVEQDASVNFGIGYSQSGLAGAVLNDAGRGIAGVTVVIALAELKRSAVTEADGSFFAAPLTAGEYEVRAEEDTLPPGYSAEALGESQRVTVGPSSPGKAIFTARAYRTISGRVLTYDAAAGRYVPVSAARVTLKPGSTIVTDASGRYLFRDLASESYTIAVEHEGQGSTRAVRLNSEPVDLRDVDFQISGPSLPRAPAPAVAPAMPEVKRPPLAASALDSDSAIPAVKSPRLAASALDSGSAVPAVKPPQLAARALESGSATAQAHNVLGRQLSTAGRYQEAIVELSTALRLAPDFALAWNARGYAFVMLRQWTRGIEDLDQAILLNPSYQNAYQIRAIARGAAGDARGAAEDSKKSKLLAQYKSAGR